MNSYTLTLVLKPELTEAERKTLLDLVTKKLTGADGSPRFAGEAGKITKEDMWGSKDLAYPIKRATKGFFVHYEATTDPKNGKAIDNTLKLEEDILRYLLVRVKG